VNQNEAGSRRVIYRGRKIDLALESVPLTDGTSAELEVVLHRGAVALVPLTGDGRVVLVKNHRHSVGRTLLEVPAGTLDPGETPESAAPRELAEETGFTADRITPIASWWVSPGVFTERMTLFVCEGLTPGAPSPQPDEKLETVILPLDEALAMAFDGRLDDAKTRLSLMLVDRWQRDHP
jgi:ADP-ribose pyrophosphatase